MIRIKIGRMLGYAGLALGASLASMSPASAFTPQPYYEYYYYDDAAHTNLVGHGREVCTYFGIFGDGPTEGTATQYYDAYQIANCDDGGIITPI